MVDVSLSNGTKLTATDHHPFWDATTGRFTYATNLHPGDDVREADGHLVTIRSVRNYDAEVVAYNITVDDIHTYYAGATPVLVHNCAASDIPGSPYRGPNAAQTIKEKLARPHAQNQPEFVTSNRIEAIKHHYGIGPSENLVFGKTGDVYTESGEHLGSLTDPQWGR